jgi:hypothetical protein
MTGAETAAAIGVPLGVFTLSGIAGGIALLVKGSAYMARSALAQESTAKSNNEINETLKTYMRSNDDRVNGIDRRVAVLEDRDTATRERRDRA